MQSIPAASTIVNVSAFIDWNSQLLLTKRDKDTDPVGTADAAFKQTVRRVARCLASIDGSLRFRVALRLYHGWHKGYEVTPNRKAAQITVAKADFASLSQRPNVVFSPLVEFGDHLLEASASRLHRKLGCHLSDTVRPRSRGGWEEKMVDTALASDVVVTAHRDKTRWIVVVTEDDDFIPPVYTAEFALTGTNSRAMILQKNIRSSLLPLDGILING
ncbi:hypothetical protein [Pelomonas sp. Root1444]|uniref:hypothetical protein n=1 Tax=Pelomonas sp. Root1444 TaxID=1736464 RepID=UPI000A65A2CE|nr:hypothetical protein [Pelomonas sp. Root1444]